MLDLLVDHLRCTGCAACYAGCSRGAITMQPDAEGFLFPVVDKTICIQCGICTRICPVDKEGVPASNDECYAAKSLDVSVVRESSSGGLFTEFSQKVLVQGGVVFGAAYVGENLDVRHIAVEESQALAELRGSKYVQSEIGLIYRDVRKALTSGREVLFSGTPCQVAGLRAYLRTEYTNLLTVEVICHGVPSAKLFSELKEEMSRAHGTLRKVSFRDKNQGWTSRAMTGWYASGEKIREQGVLNDYFKAFIAHLTLRHSCERCHFTAGRSGADVTLGDFWGVESIIPNFNDNTGVSAVIIHTDKGRRAFANLSCIKESVPLSAITRSNPSYTAQRSPDRRRNAFMAMTIVEDIHIATKRYLLDYREPLWYRIVRKMWRYVRTLAGCCGLGSDIFREVQ